MTRVVALIQARMGSTRFPGKMLADLGGHPVLEWVLTRVSKSHLIDAVVVATTNLNHDDAIVTLAKNLGIEVFRGSEMDVLGRFAAAAEHYQADTVVRICADNPFIDPGELDRLITHFKNGTFDYAFNHQDRLGGGYPDGFGAEILSNNLLQQISLISKDAQHREHATLYLWDHASLYCMSALTAPSDLAYPNLRFDIDCLSDLVYLQKLVNSGVHIESEASQIIQIACSNKCYTLVTTDIDLEPASLIDNTYFLGRWCFSSRHNERLANEAGRIIDFHWNDRDKLKRDFDLLGGVYEELLEELSNALNKLHGINESKSFWRITLGYWLNIYITVVFDRWSSLEQAIKTRYSWRTLVLPLNEKNLITADTKDFICAATESSRWNHDLFSLLLRYFPEINSIKIDGEVITDNIPMQKNNLLRLVNYFLKRIFSTIIGIVKNRDKYFLINTYIPFKESVSLEVALGQLPLPYQIPEWVGGGSSDLNLRMFTLPIDHNKNKCEIIIRELLPKLIPRIFIEDFKRLMVESKKLPWPKYPKVIFTSNCHFGNDIFNAWAAKKISKGARLVIGEHGGLGTCLFNGAHRYEISIADLYLSTGWMDANHSKIKPIGNFRKSSNNLRFNTAGKGLLVCGNMPRYSFDIRSMMLSSQVIEYFQDQLSFIDALPKAIQDAILVRLQPTDYGWGHMNRILDRFPRIQFDDSSLSLEDSLGKCRLFIGTYNATTYIQALYLNFPTVMFWNPSNWEVKPESQPFFDRLNEVGIMHYSPEGAAKHIISIWHDILGWWKSEKVQIARELFCNAYISSPPNLMDRLKSVLLEEAKRSTTFPTH